MTTTTTAAAGGHATAPATGARRLVGIDLARAVAFGGMLLAHFAYSRPGDPAWMRTLDQAADGRAAPLFCVLLGVGAGLLAARGTADAVLLRRGLVLFGLGLAIWPFVDEIYLILPHYGLMLAAFPLLRRLSTRALLPAAATAFVVPSLVAAIAGGQGIQSGVQPSSYAELLDAGALLWQLLWTGGYPVVGWVGFVFVGMWVVRQDLADVAVQWRLLAGGGAIALAQLVFGAMFSAFGGSSDGERARGLAAFFDGTAHSNQTAWYVLAAATAVAVLAACLVVARRAVGGRLVSLGQTALTAYLAHIVVGNVFVWDWLRDAEPGLGAQITLVAVVFVAFAGAATAWKSRYRRGPVEAVVRSLSR